MKYAYAAIIVLLVPPAMADTFEIIRTLVQIVRF